VTGNVVEVVRGFARSVQKKFASPVKGQPEDQLKGPVERLLVDIGLGLGLAVVAKGESGVHDVGRPDFGLDVEGLLTGHLELKAPGKGARPDHYSGADREQWRKFKALPNLVYTDGTEWSLYNTGKLSRRLKLTGDITTPKGWSEIDENDATQLQGLLLVFFSWEPIVPESPKQLAEILAPLCRLLRSDVLAALAKPNSSLSQLKKDWRMYLFPDCDDAQFSDAYAQTLTYALLLAHSEGLSEVEVEDAVKQLKGGHALLSRVLQILADDAARIEIGTAIGILERAISTVKTEALSGAGSDPWLYFYEDVLAAYDADLRRDRGVYYTPVAVVRTQVQLVAELLKKLGKQWAFADADVVTLDPAAGTGSYPLFAIEYSLKLVAKGLGQGAVSSHASALARNINAFELLVGPYAVAHLRLTERIVSFGGTIPKDGVHVFLTDTLESPYAQPPGALPLVYRPLTDEHKRAQDVKANTRVLVCLGNPPYDRQVIDADHAGMERKGGWVRFGDNEQKQLPILEDFLQPARLAGAGGHLKNVYNDYVYFWRWALWKVFETTNGPGVVSFITAASYLRGPGFVGMREVMRRTFDDLWIIDLGGDSRGARKSQNVFAIQTPVAIAVGVRYGKPRPEIPATVRYAEIRGDREQKLAALEKVRSFEDLDWRACYAGWHQPFLPEGTGDYFLWPLLSDLFPWQQAGVKVGRTWPIAPDEDTLSRRWETLTETMSSSRRVALFKDSPTVRKSDGPTANLVPQATETTKISDAKTGAKLPSLIRYGYRYLDRQWLLADGRLIDRPSPSLWLSHSDEQVYFISFLTEVLGEGPAIVATAEIPDLHYFRGSFGGKHVIPLWRDKEGKVANIANGVLGVVSRHFGFTVSAEDLFAYCYAILACQAYSKRYSEELTVPGPRVPISKEPTLFKAARALGQELLWYHTFGERFLPPGTKRGSIPPGHAKCLSSPW